MKYRVTDISLPLFNLDGTIRKAMKSKLQECLYFVSENLHSNIAIIDMGLLWRAALPTKEDREAPGVSQLIWKWYAEKMFRLTLERHPNAEEIHLINDRYDVDFSIKKCEQEKRSASYTGGSRNIYPKVSQVLPSASTFRGFFGNPENKIRLQKLLHVEFQRLVDDKVDIYYTINQWCYHRPLVLPSTNGVTI